MPVEVSLSVAKTTSMPGVLAQQAVDLGRVEALAPARLVADELGAVGLAELDPALAELAGGAGEHRRAGADEVGDGGLHRAGAAGGEREHVVLGLEDRAAACASTRS